MTLLDALAAALCIFWGACIVHVVASRRSGSGSERNTPSTWWLRISRGSVRDCAPDREQPPSGGDSPPIV